MGKYPETGALIERLRKFELDIITVIDQDIKNNSMQKKDGIIYATKDFLKAAKTDLVTEYHYHNIAPGKRMDGVAWKVKKVKGLMHEFYQDG